VKAYQRADRVGGQIRKELSALLHKEISDPRLAEATITGVDVSRDLRIAKVYFVSLGGSAQCDTVMAGFIRAKGYLKRILAGRLRLRYMPDLTFYYDESFDYGDRIERLLRQLDTDSHG